MHPKAVASCNDTISHLGDDLETDAGALLEDGAVVSFCGSLSPSEALTDPGGPDFSLQHDGCMTRFGFSSIPFIQSYSGCVLDQTYCVAERLLLVRMPRTRDLLASVGVDTTVLSAMHDCLPNENGSGVLNGSDPKPGKALLACEKSEVKAGGSFVAKARGACAKCADAVMSCAQLTPTQKCIDSAAKTCTKAVATADAAQGKLATAVGKACGKIPLDDLLNADGGDVSALAPLCTSVGVTLTTLADYGTCLAKYERCQVEDSVDFTVPRIEEFFTATSQPSPFNSAFCPAP